jgi:serine/threonine protein kinase
MGRVFLGLSAGGRPVAVKVIRPDLAADPEFRMRFGREVAAARRVSGLFTAMVVDADVDGPVAWLATAYVAGPSLHEAVNDHGPLPARSLLSLAAGLAESLSAIHAAGVVHRDLKPLNVMLAEDGPRVIDFGISRAVEGTALTQAGLVIGSPGFMSPEQAEGLEVGPPTDIFSLGAVLAFAATGQGPFGIGTTAAMLYRVVHGAANLDQMPAEVRPLIERCLAKDQRQRPTADALLTEIGALQPSGDWLPDSIVRAFARDTPTASAPVLAIPGLATPGLATPGLATPGASPGASPGFSSAAAQTTHASSPGQPASTDSQLLAAPETNPMIVDPGSPPLPPGGAHRQPPPGGRNRPRRRLLRSLLLALVIGVLLGASAAAGFALTAATGHTPKAPIEPRQAALTSSPTAAASAGQIGASAAASNRPSASASASSFPSASRSASASASASAAKSPSPSTSASRSPSPSPSPTTSASASPSPSPSPSASTPTSAAPTSSTSTTAASPSPSSSAST